ncbi:MAG: hypothetical protein ACP5NP_08955 [Acetobacteraceae bacterium]
MLLGIVIYLGILFGPSLIAKCLGLSPGVFGLLVSVLFIPPVAALDPLLVDRTARKRLLIVGFAGSAVSLGLFAWLHDVAMAVPAFGFAPFDLDHVMIVGGPGMDAGAGLLGATASPTRIRSIGHAINMVGRRIGLAASSLVGVAWHDVRDPGHRAPLARRHQHQRRYAVGCSEGGLGLTQDWS